MDFSQSPWPEAAIGFGGVMLGGVITIVVNAIANHQHRRDVRLGLAYSIKFKAQRASSFLVRVFAHLDADLKPEVKGPSWGRIKELVVSSIGDIAFSSEELAMLAQFDEGPFADRLQDLAAKYNLLTRLVDKYGTARRQLLRALEARGHVDMKDGGFAVLPSALDDAQTAGLLAEIDVHVQSLLAEAKGGNEFARGVAADVHPLLSKHLNDKRFKYDLRIKEEL